ncbi:MAG TPA: SDR family NAD(P)-dependent oxidoreductase [Candidatus Sulfotelmatobacter sp.]|nr:SDR family NAD(P)-dependent oxidoreductase [Candidatus Sulfotelmatobacter sp.]
MSVSTKTVVISGASSGIGWSSVRRMSRAGWEVFATVRKESDCARLRADFAGKVFPVLLDVEKETSIAAAAAEIESRLSGRGLDGLVNVAGIGMVRPLEYASMGDIRQIFEVNFFGQLACIQAFSRMLRRQRGRIVNITSVGVNVAIPFGGLLNASKSAFAKISDTLRLEMHPFGVRVIAIEPGSISTPAVEKTLGDLEQVIRHLPPEAQAQYGSMIRKMGRRGYEMEKNGSSPDVVAEAVHHALTSNRPRIRYRVGRHAKLLAALPKILPESVMDALLRKMLGIADAPDRNRESAEPRPVHPAPAVRMNRN